MRKIVYVVAIPWDSASVDSVHVFKTYKKAREFCDWKNEQGYNGYANGLEVKKCRIIP